MTTLKDPQNKIIRAAGGLVENEKGEVLFMFRRSTWDLPKGKMDEGESPEVCAVREVNEETGIRNIVLKEFLITTHHVYEERGIFILKQTDWFRMKASANQTLVPQLEEDITELKWIGETGFGEVAANTFPTIIEVLEAGGYRIG
jgi:8-oxo-dGTP pyrophosphatase MutT (NUDIX family)